MYTEKFELYKRDVIAAYRKKQNDEPDQDWLIHPTPAKVKQLCMRLTQNKLEKHDEITLRNFLAIGSDDIDYHTVIRRKDAEDFKTFRNFLDKPETRTGESSVELLAWLINFQGRPYAEYKKTGQVQQVSEETKEKEPEIMPPENGAGTEQKIEDDRDQKETVTPKISWWLVAVGLILLAGVLGFLFIFKKDNCMYWNGEHYVATSCNIPRPDTPLIPLDMAKLTGFRKLKRIDTLTGYAVGRFWYSAKGRQNIEVFTADGANPVYPDRKLKKVTDWVVIVCRESK